MEHLELTILGLLVAITALSVLARLVHVPYPIALVLGGLALGFVPGIGSVTLSPDLVLLIFLPPLLYGAAFFSNPRELKNNIRPIGWLAVGLVFATTGAVAVVGHELVGLSWGVAFVLGAVVSPTDAVAPAQIIRRFGVPRRVVTVIEGENLTNDWTALTIYRFATVAVVSGAFSWGSAAPRFVLTGVGGIAVGLLAGTVLRWIRRHLDDPPTEITISLFSGFVAYIPAEELGLSGVIAAVTVGLYMGWHSAELTTPTTRMQGQGAWEVLTFLLNAVLFILVGLQFPGLIDHLSGQSTGQLLLYATAVSVAVVVVRLAWVLGLAHGLPRLLPRLFEDAPQPPLRVTLLIGWSSMRGAVALAAALAIPTTVDGGGPFPDRPLVIFLTYSVILATLVVQGLTLGPLITALRLRSDGLDEQEEVAARIRMTEAGLARIDALVEEGSVASETAERTRALRDFRRRRFEARMDGDSSIDERSQRYQDFMHQVIAAEREALVLMRNAGEITDDVRRTVERDLDLEEARLS
jgi:monovalent cation/hydrogen antiporter